MVLEAVRYQGLEFLMEVDKLMYELGILEGLLVLAAGLVLIDLLMPTVANPRADRFADGVKCMLYANTELKQPKQLFFVRCFQEVPDPGLLLQDQM
jgi:hypothetical protein